MMNDYKPITGELDLFLLFYELDRLNYLLRSRLDNGVIPEASLKHVQAVLKELNKKRAWALTLLPQFGVEPYKLNAPSITEEYRAWFKWWKDYFLGFSEELRLKVMEGLSEEEKKTMVPPGTWKSVVCL
jgi:hypothetical protein